MNPLTAMSFDMVQRVLVLAPNWIGDAVMCTPALQGICQTFTSAEICLLARPSVCDLLQDHSCVDRIIEYDHQGLHSGLIGKWRLAQTVRSFDCDIAVLLPNSFDAALVAFFSRIPRRLGYATGGRSLLLTDPITLPIYAKKIHQVKYYEDLIRPICPKYSSKLPNLNVSKDNEMKTAQLFASYGVPDDSTLLGLNPGSIYGGAKRWLPERFAEAADQIVKNFSSRGISNNHMRCVIVGAPGEEALGRRIADMMRVEPIVLSGKTSIGVLKAVIQRCRLFLTNDTGPMHIANALGVPVVAVFGPTDHSTTSPCSEGYVLVRTSVHCSPCMLRECPIDHQCMTGVSVEKVVQAAERIFDEGSVSLVEQIKFNP